MTTGGAPRPGAVRGCALGLVPLTGAGLAGGGEPGTNGRTATGTSDATPARSASASPSATPPFATPPEDLCGRIVAYWSREVLDTNTYGDYQSMGLSNGQYEIPMDVVDAARAEQEHNGPTAAQRLIDRGAHESREDRHRDGGPAKGPWR
ncbi:hypothetical protein [Streptomyces sp. 2A115]|uniref:hypothetical protein n=1 Tax=Streptomyces sp. 2A115 TaxID=3457439 RepID=UPI003FD2D633